MTTLQIDPDLRKRLRELGEPLEFHDEHGHKLGYFIPSGPEEAEAYAWARNAFSDEELERSRREEGGFTLHEILDELEGR